MRRALLPRPPCFSLSATTRSAGSLTGNDLADQRRARTSVNLLLRQAKSLFSKKAMRFLMIKLPDPLPFENVDFEPRQSMRYHSTIDPWTLISDAQTELENGAGDKPEQYKIFLLSLHTKNVAEWRFIDHSRYECPSEEKRYLLEYELAREAHALGS